MNLETLKRLHAGWRARWPQPGGVPFSLEISDSHGCTVLRVNGFLDMSTSIVFKDELLRWAAQGKPRIVVDLRAEIRHPWALAAIVGGLRRVRANHGDLALVCMRRATLRTLRVTGIIKVLPIYKDVDAAVDSLTTLTCIGPRESHGREDML